MAAAASAYNHTLEPLDKRISKYIGGVPIRIDGKPRASGVMDTVSLSRMICIAFLTLDAAGPGGSCPWNQDPTGV